MLPEIAMTFALMRERAGVRLDHSSRHAAIEARCSAFSDRPAAADQKPVKPNRPSTYSVVSPRPAPGAIQSRRRLVSQQPAAEPAASSDAGPDPEVRSIQAALRGIKQDPLVRARFYADVDALIREVRNHEPIPRNLMIDEELPLSPRHAAGTAVSADLPPVRGYQRAFTATPAAELPPVTRRADPLAKSPDLALGPVLSPKGRPLDPAVISRVVYWANVNGCPVELALATAWQESGMSLYPARGASGEIGIMQILPERAGIEGVSPSRLDDPETNLRLGTKLLARYYREEGSVARAAMKYVGGPGVFEKRYSPDVRQYIEWYSGSVNSYAEYFGQYLHF